MAKKQHHGTHKEEPKKEKTTINRTMLIVIGAAVLLFFALLMSGLDGTITGEAKSSSIKAQCADGLDNDGDGYCDYLTRRTSCRDGSIPGDSDCASATDNKEAPDCIPAAEVCDGYDNNCNSQADEGLYVTCSSASNCGTSSWSSSYCGSDGDVYRDYTSYQCNFPGTCSSSCASQTNSYLQADCGTRTCFNGQCMNATNSTG